MTWLKLILKCLGLKERATEPTVEATKAMVMKVLTTSQSIRGYRAVWKYLEDKYCFIVNMFPLCLLFIVVLHRKTVMEILRKVDPPDGVSLHKKNET